MTSDTNINIRLTQSAAKRISDIIAEETTAKMLRISVEGGGCSGFQYKYVLVDDKNDDDLVLERDGATVLIDEVSQPFMNNAEIDFEDSLIGAAFKINNPNAVAACGCGTSFSI